MKIGSKVFFMVDSRFFALKMCRPSPQRMPIVVVTSVFWMGSRDGCWRFSLFILFMMKLFIMRRKRKRTRPADSLEDSCLNYFNRFFGGGESGEDEEC